MQDELITSDNLSPELLKSLFDAAYMEPTVDKDAEIILQEADVDVRVIADMENKDRIHFMTVFGFKEDSKPLARLECANRINKEVPPDLRISRRGFSDFSV